MRMLLLLLGISMSTVALAHPGHDQMVHSSLLAGMLHPFTGLDHLTMGLGLGVLMSRMMKQARLIGLGLLLVALAGGFMLGVQHLFVAQVAEYGIALSLIMLAVALWQRSRSLYIMVLMGMGVFHGMAHGNELSAGVQPELFMLGMMLSLGLLYMAGVLCSRWLKQYLSANDRSQHSDRVAAFLVGAVAIFELAV